MVAGFLLFGTLLAKYRFVEFLESGFRNKWFWIHLLVFVAIAAVCLVFLPANTDLYRVQIGDYGIFSVYTFALTSLSCGLVQLYIALLFSKIPGISHLFNLMGENVLYLFLLHMLVAKMLIAPFVHLDTTVNIPLDFYPALGLAFVTIAVILVMSHIYRRIRPDLIAKIKGESNKAEGA
jgi:fucose 4-O-acetylase-like acetyltransferase